MHQTSQLLEKRELKERRKGQRERRKQARGIENEDKDERKDKMKTASGY